MPAPLRLRRETCSSALSDEGGSGRPERRCANAPGKARATGSQADSEADWWKGATERQQMIEIAKALTPRREGPDPLEEPTAAPWRRGDAALFRQIRAA